MDCHNRDRGCRALHTITNSNLFTYPPLSLFFVIITDQNESSLGIVVTTAVVCVAGLPLGVLLTQFHGHCHRKQKRGQTEIPPVYEDITLEKTPPAIELHSNHDAIGGGWTRPRDVYGTGLRENVWGKRFFLYSALFHQGASNRIWRNSRTL